MNPPPTSLRSIKSVPSTTKSGKSYGTISDNEEMDFEHIMIELYKRFSCPFAVVVGKEYRDYNRRQKNQENKTKFRRVSVAPPSPDADSLNTIFDVNTDTDHDNVVAITAVYDGQKRLSELLITNFYRQVIPRIIIQLIGLVVSNYAMLFKFTIKNSRVDMLLLYELGKMLPYSTITEVCLDDCPLNKANYEVVLKNPSSLKSLSLCRCRINDDVCERLASKLIYLESAAEHLITLNLTSNHIGDKGAKYFAEALRSNRHLRYLNLADNLISDEGANFILSALIEFPLTQDENIDRRHRYMLYLKKKHVIYLECLRKFVQPRKPSVGSVRSNASKKHTSGSRAKKGDSTLRISPVRSKGSFKRKSSSFVEDIPMKAEMMARDLIGPFVDPFDPTSVRIVDGYPRCIGNFILCYLNIAYNELTYASVKKLLTVVEYQSLHYNTNACGLMKVILVGNCVPAGCWELTTISHILNRHMACFQTKQSSARKSVFERKMHT